jgi:penicillin-binding protein 1A
MTPDGAIRAMVGGTDYRASQFNRTTQALRQPGSAFKAFVYLAAFEAGFTPESQFVDTPITIGKWRPSNYQDKFYGTVDLREAFARSLNSVAVQLSEETGRHNVIETAKRLGIASPLGNDASIALGTSESTVLEMTGAYATFANLGNGVWPRGIERISARDGTVLYERLGSGPGEVASGQAVRKMLDVMQATVDWGTAKKAKLDRPVYGKTGTSQSFRDAWFVGLSRDLVTGVWVGNDDNTPMDKVTGGSLPVAIWHDFMAGALAGTPPEDVRRPQSVEAVAIATPKDLGKSKTPEEDGSWLENLLGGGAASKPNAERDKTGLRPTQGSNK